MIGFIQLVSDIKWLNRITLQKTFRKGDFSEEFGLQAYFQLAIEVNTAIFPFAVPNYWWVSGVPSYTILALVRAITESAKYLRFKVKVKASL